MPTIAPDPVAVTQITVFTCSPDNQQALVDHLIRSAVYAKQIPGFVSSSIHKGLDGKSVANYIQAEDEGAQARIFAELKAKGFIDQGKKYGEAHVGLYHAVSTLEWSFAQTPSQPDR